MSVTPTALGSPRHCPPLTPASRLSADGEWSHLPRPTADSQGPCLITCLPRAWFGPDSPLTSPVLGEQVRRGLSSSLTYEP